MIRKKAGQPVKDRPEMYGGAGVVRAQSLLLGEEELEGKGRLYSVLTIPEGGSIGHHVHEGESETFYVLSGSGEFEDDGIITPFEAGDLLRTPAGGGHGLKNTGAGPLQVLALILYA